MALDTTEEEQVEALKRWWKENGTSLLTGVVIVLAVMLGARKWQDSQSATAGQASDLYEQIAQIAVANVTKIISDDDMLAAQNVYSQLKEQHKSSIYTRYAALAMAKFHADKEEIDQSAAELQWILDNESLGMFDKAEPELLQTVRERLARLKLAKGDAQGALDLVRKNPPGSYTVSYAETEGDALLQLGDQEGAKAAYLKAIQAIGDGNPAILKIKLQDLGVSGADIPK